MAKKRNTNKFGHAFVCEWLGKNWFRDEQGKITDEAGTYAGDTFNKLINDQYPIVMPDDVEKKPKKKNHPRVVFVLLVGRARFELATNGLQMNI